MTFRAFTTILVLAAVLDSSQVLALEILLTDLIHSLQTQGINIVYSSALVNSDDAVDVEVVTLEELQRALPDLGLKLEPIGDVWIVMRGDDKPMTRAATSAAS